ncbi:MAG: MvdC/MvdD family ATP grasp protein, partial [Ilumatobacteraceae bacterium]
MIVVVSRASDVHADAVLAHLARRGQQTALVDLSMLPTMASLTMQYPCCTDCEPASPRIVLRGQAGDIDMRQATAVWWRRPQNFDVSALEGDGRAFAYNEWYEAVAGMWAMIGGAFWVND